MVDAQMPRIVKVAISEWVVCGFDAFVDSAMYAFSSSSASKYSIKPFLIRSSQVHSPKSDFFEVFALQFGYAVFDDDEWASYSSFVAVGVDFFGFGL